MIHNRQKTLGKCWLIVIMLGSVLLPSCATVREIVQTFKPGLALKDVHLTDLTFEEVELAVDVGVDNPNPFPIDLTGFDYDLKINAISFLKGQQDKQLTIESLGESEFQIPVTLNFKNLYETFKSLKDQDNTAYQIDCGVLFELPGLGPTRIPLSTEGEFPAVKLPNIRVDGLKVKKLSLSGADMELKLHMKNPNAFDLLLNSVNYELAVNGKTWAKGVGEQAAQISKKGESAIGIPISLDFGQIGLTVYQALSGKEKLNYQFQGNLGVGSSLPLLKQATIPMDSSGVLNILR